jgi:hypothetical protein
MRYLTIMIMIVLYRKIHRVLSENDDAPATTVSVSRHAHAFQR